MGFKRSWVQIPPARHLLRPAGQKRIDQFRQVVAVSAFKDRSRRNVDLSEPFAEACEVFVLKSHLHERIARVSVESGRDQNEIRLERDQFVERKFANIDIFLPW